jgi:hypothetical protein
MNLDKSLLSTKITFHKSHKYFDESTMNNVYKRENIKKNTIKKL